MSLLLPADPREAVRILAVEVLRLQERLSRLENVPPTEPPPKPPTWRDVTAECEWEDGELWHREKGHAVAIGCEPDYRLTKISGPLKPHVAFIVEKQE